MKHNQERTRYRVVGYDPYTTVCGVCGKSELDGTVVLQDAGGDNKRAGAGCAAKLAGGRPSVVLHRAKKLSLATPSWLTSPEAVSYHAPFPEVLERADDLRKSAEFQSWIKDSTLKNKKGRPKIFYRGVLNPARIKKGMRVLPSYTSVPAAAAIYSMTTGDEWGRYPPRLTENSTVNSAFIKAKNPLRLYGLWTTFGNFLRELQYGKPNGITDREVLSTLAYMHNRLVGKRATGSFDYRIVDEDGDVIEPDIGDMLHGRTQIANLYDDIKMWPDETLDFADSLQVATYVLFDAPPVVTAARRLGYDAFIYTDPFHPGQASEILFDKQAGEMWGVDEDYNIEDEDEPTIDVVRPFSDEQVRSIIPGGVSTTTFLHGLPGVPKARRMPNKRRRRHRR